MSIAVLSRTNVKGKGRGGFEHRRTFKSAGIETIKKVIKNILQNPHEEKFRRLKISGKVFRLVQFHTKRHSKSDFRRNILSPENKIFSEKLLPTEGAIPLLYDLGFQESGLFELYHF